MTRLMVFLVLGLVASVVVARNVESEKDEKIDDTGEEAEDEEEETRSKRMANDDLLEQEWNELMSKRKMDQALRELKKAADAEFVAVEEPRDEYGQHLLQKKCKCHVHRVNGVAVKKCFPEHCDMDEKNPRKDEFST